MVLSSELKLVLMSLQCGATLTCLGNLMRTTGLLAKFTLKSETIKMRNMCTQTVVKCWSKESFCSSGNNHKGLDHILIYCYVESLQCILWYMDNEVTLC